MIFRIFLGFFVSLASTLANAETFPKLYEISDDKRAVIRAAPSDDALEIGNLGPVHGWLEVLGLQGDWAEVSTPYGESWTLLADLTLVTASEGMPTEFSCLGHDPTWLLERRSDSVFVDFLEGYILTFENAAELASAFGLVAYGPDGPMSLELSRGECRLPNNNFRYGLKAMASIPDFSLSRSVIGCCSLKS